MNKTSRTLPVKLETLKGEMSSLLKNKFSNKKVWATPTVSLKGQLKEANLAPTSSFFGGLKTAGNALYQNGGWTLLQKRAAPKKIVDYKTAAVRSNTGTPTSIGADASAAIKVMDQFNTKWGFITPGAIQLRKNTPMFFGRYQDDRGYIRQLPKADRNMFNTATKDGKLAYDAWMMTSAWNKFAGYWSQYQKDNSRSDGYIKNVYTIQQNKILPNHASMQNMLNWLRTGRLKAMLPIYGCTNQQALVKAVTEAAMKRDWTTYLAAKTKLSAAITKDTDATSKDSTSRYAMAKSLIQTQVNMTRNLVNKKKQGVTSLADKLAIEKNWKTYQSQVQKSTPVNFPILRSAEWGLTKQQLERGMAEIRQGRKIASFKAIHGKLGQAPLVAEKKMQQSTNIQQDPFDKAQILDDWYRDHKLKGKQVVLNRAIKGYLKQIIEKAQTNPLNIYQLVRQAFEAGGMGDVNPDDMYHTFLKLVQAVDYNQDNAMGDK